MVVTRQFILRAYPMGQRLEAVPAGVNRLAPSLSRPIPSSAGEQAAPASSPLRRMGSKALDPGGIVTTSPLVDSTKGGLSERSPHCLDEATPLGGPAAR